MESADIFPETNWSVVRVAGADTTASLAALDELYTRYRNPVLKLVKRYGFPVGDAEDVAQDYFASLIGREYLAKADRDTGRFRAFVSHNLKLFLHNARRKRWAQMRGGGSEPLSLDQLKEESGFDLPEARGCQADDYFDTQWALETVRHAMEQLAGDYRRRGQENVFRRLSKGLREDMSDADYAAQVAELGMTLGAVKVAMHRLRDRFRRAVEDRGRNTVATEEDFHLEMAHLRHSLALVK